MRLEVVAHSVRSGIEFGEGVAFGLAGVEVSNSQPGFVRIGVTTQRLVRDIER